MTTTTGAAPMSAAEVLARMERMASAAESHRETLSMTYTALDLQYKLDEDAIAAVAAMAEREAAQAERIKVLEGALEFNRIRADAQAKEVEALAVRLKALESEVSARRAGWASFVDDEDPSLLVVAHQDRSVHFTGASAWDDANAIDAARAEARDG